MEKVNWPKLLWKSTGKISAGKGEQSRHSSAYCCIHHHTSAYSPSLQKTLCSFRVDVCFCASFRRWKLTKNLEVSRINCVSSWNLSYGIYVSQSLSYGMCVWLAERSGSWRKDGRGKEALGPARKWQLMVWQKGFGYSRRLKGIPGTWRKEFSK